MEELMDYDQEYTETPSKFPNMFSASSFEQMHQPAIDMLLDEILDVQIFSKYFDYHYWMWYIMPVCKKWQRLCERSRMPKQITIRMRIGRPLTIKIIARHQPDVIQVDYGKDQVRPKLSIYSIMQLVKASKKCHTLVLAFPIVEAGITTLESQKLPQITTLCIHEKDLHCLEFFPNVQSLQIHNVLEKKLERKIIPNSVEELSVRRSVNGLIWICCNNPDKVFSILETDPHNALDEVERLNSWLKRESYAEFFRHHSASKLAKLVHVQRFDDARKLLQTQETTLQRELELSNDQRIYRTQNMDSLKHYDYVFGDHPFCVTRVWVSFFDVENFYEKEEIARDIYDQMATCRIEVRPDVKLNLIAKFGTAKEAINAIKNLTSDHMTVKATYALFNLIVREDVRQLLLKKQIFKIFLRTVLANNNSPLLDYCKDVDSVKKLAEFVDWSEFLPRYVSGRTVKEVFAYAVRMGIQYGATKKYNVVVLRSLCSYLTDSDDWSVFDEFLESNGTSLGSFLNSIPCDRIGIYMSKDLYIKILKRYKYDVNEVAVHFVRSYMMDTSEFTKEFKVDWKIAVERANDTPYFHIVNDASMMQKLHILLQNGVDPRFFPKNSPSIISHFIVNAVLITSRKIALIDALLAFGVDINEPSFNFMNQSHTPLSLAKLLPKPNIKLIEHLEARGAVLDEDLMMN